VSAVATEAASPRPVSLRLGGLGRLRRPAVGLLAGMLAWEALGRILAVQFFPPFSAVIARLVEMTASGEIIPSLTNSLTNLVVGFAVSATFGLTVGALMGVYRKVDRALDIYIYALLTAPSLVFAPLFFSLFGLDRMTIVAVIFMYSAFFIVINTAAAIKAVPSPLVEMGRSYCANDRQLFFEIILPAALPLVMAGLRLGMGRAVKGMINGEMFIAAVGLGKIVIEAQGAFDATTVLAVLLLIIIVALLAIKAVQIVDARLTGWLPSTARARRRA
jgi:ABC-type nitrate/sulfonate/bicarbonate transport system permease component